MSKKKQQISNQTSFVYEPTNELPKLSRVRTEWDVKKHYYKNERDPQIAKDAQRYERACRSFIRKYKDNDFTESPHTLVRALQDYEALLAMNEGVRVIQYFNFRTIKNVNDAVAEKKLHQYADQFRALATEMTFFKLRIGSIPKQTQRRYRKDPTLAQYHYFLQRIFESAAHMLSEAEENILTLREKTSRDMWQTAVDKIVSNRSVTHNGSTYKIPEALEVLDTLNWQEKQDLWDAILHEMVDIAAFAEHELSAICNHDKVEDQLRKYAQPYSETVRAYEDDEAAVEALVDAISRKGFALSRKFYKLKARIHKVDRIPYACKYEPIGTLPQPQFNEAVTLCRDTFYGLKTTYGEIFDSMLSNGQLDVFPKSGKEGGAFMSARTGVPTYVMMNYVPSFRSVETLAHEMGHAIHAELSKSQPVLYQHFSTTTAETASTLFEQLTLEKFIASLPPAEQVVALHDKLTRDIATVQRQIACFNFELKMHRFVREHGIATKEDLARMMQRELRAYLGPAVTVTEADGYSFVYWSHIRYGFYVYTYTFGHLISNLMVQRYNADPQYVQEIDTFLHAGGSNSVQHIFRACDIDTQHIETFLDSLRTQEQEIKRLEKLTNNR